MPSRVTATGLKIAAILVLITGLKIGDASATLLLGQQLYYQGGSLTITILPYDASYTSNLYLFSTAAPLLLGSNLEVGKVVDINLGALGFAINDEVVFGILVNNTGNTFVSGLASRNFDNAVHAGVENVDLNTFRIGFEDLPAGQSDEDYNDFEAELSGGVGVEKIRLESTILATPEPASIILLMLGWAGLAYFNLRKRA